VYCIIEIERGIFVIGKDRKRAEIGIHRVFGTMANQKYGRVERRGRKRRRWRNWLGDSKNQKGRD
jgi:hypothetical protein